MKLLLATLACAGLLLGVGCDSKKKTNAKNTQGDGIATQKEPEIVVALENQQDLDSVRKVLQQLDNLEGNIGNRPTMTEAERTALSKFLTLTAVEWNDLEQKPYNQNDAAYLEECLLLRAAVRGLNIDALPPLPKATAGFDWVCRSVYIDTLIPRPSSAWAVLHAGSGVPLSRAYAVIAAWQQLGFDTCLIGGPKLATTPSSPMTNEQVPPAQRTFAPVRACGVLIDGEILLFDHRAGKPLAGPGGKGIATLNQVRTEPKLAAALAEADEVNAWQPYIASPLPALAKRMQSLEKLNPGASRVKLAIDAVALRERLQAKHPGVPCTFWNPDNDPFSATRIVNTYAAAEAEDVNKVVLRQKLRVECVPMEALPKTEYAGMVSGTVRRDFSVRFERLRWESGSPRDAIIRGMFKDATAGLMHVKGELEREKSRAEQNKVLLENFPKIAERMQSLTAERERAKRDRNEGAMNDAAAKFDAFMKDGNTQLTLRNYVMTHAGPPLTAELYYLLAASVHERAERSTGTIAKADWENARDWWKRYLDASTEAKSPFPARDKHAETLLQRCESQLK